MERDNLGEVEINGSVILTWIFENVTTNHSTATFGGSMRNMV
jgi:hypothetical protein